MKNKYVKLLNKEVKSSDWTGFIHCYPHKKAYRNIPNIDMKQIWEGIDEFNLYVHIPFCDRKCAYCNLFSTVLNQTEKENMYDRYVDKLIEEIDVYSKYINKNAKIMSLYFGGGTPNVLSIKQFDKIIKKLKSVFTDWDDNIEICTECSPDRLSLEYIKGLKAIGFKRISVGVQSFIQSELDAVNRKIDIKIVDDIAKWTKQENIGLNLDLIYGLPFQTKQTIMQNINKLTTLAPDNVCVYPLAIRKFTGMENIDKKYMFTNSQKYAIFNNIRAKLERSGYVCQTITRFVKSNTPTYQQQRYEYQGISTLGIGAGARSCTPNVAYCITYKVQDKLVKSIIEEYMNTKTDERNYVGFIYNDEELKRKFVMLSLLDPGIDLNGYYKEFGVKIEDDFKTEIEALLKTKMIELNKPEDMYLLTSKGRKYCDIAVDIFVSKQVRNLYNTYQVE
ncbi:MAG: radical SAM protein [Clostridia bacterium]|nr:radical SAM protein [Clostridia bacterium]